MFQRRNQRSLKRALDQASDGELRDLQEELNWRQERVAQLEFELSDTNANLGRFSQKLEDRLGALQTRLEELELEVEQARLRAARKAQWGDRADSPDLHVDVLEQYRRTWTPKEKPPPPPPEEPGVSEQTRAELKTLFRTLAKRFHPDLVTDPEEKRWRVKIMAQVNEAYAALDVAELRRLSTKPDRAEAPAEKTREQILTDLRNEIRRLDGVIRNLERGLADLINSHTVQLMLEVTIAERSGRDLLGEMAVDLRQKIADLEAEYARLT
jgi:multidrug efflux pump subunit AcrA (membrane-fusion protein)